jgi:branched-chain amino acid transport system substrate-binding protein
VRRGIRIARKAKARQDYAGADGHEKSPILGHKEHQVQRTQPGKEVLYFNYAAIDPVLTNDKCSFWHFRWDANSDIKMEALTNYMKGIPSIKKLYLINQDYSFGQSVRSQAKAMLAAKRPDVQIVGDELHPLLKITDFAPYIAKIKASGADSVLTGNWGQDFALLLKAAADSGLRVNWYTYYAGSPGAPTAIKQGNLNNQVFEVNNGVANIANASAQALEKAVRSKYGFRMFYPTAVNEMRMLAAAAEKAESLEPVKIALALEGMEFDVYNGGTGYMRKDDYQFFQPMYNASFGELTTHPQMVGHLGHNVDRIFMMVFGIGTALAALAGVIAGPALQTQHMLKKWKQILLKTLMD